MFCIINNQYSLLRVNLLSISLFIALSFNVFAGNDLKLNFERLDNTVGLPTNEIRRIEQDSEGYIWFVSTNGLIRYDGYDFQLYRNTIDNPNLLTSNAIRCFGEDLNYLWIGTERGLNRWNKKLRKIEKINLQDIDVQIYKILVSNENYIWLATKKGIIKYFPDNNTCVIFSPDGVNDIYMDSKGRIWFGFWQNGLERYNPADDSLIHYPDLSKKNSVHVIFEDKAGTLWLGTWGVYRVINDDEPTETKYIQYSTTNNIAIQLHPTIYTLSIRILNMAIYG